MFRHFNPFSTKYGKQDQQGKVAFKERKAYKALKESEMLIFPSRSTYNIIRMSGFQSNNLKWMEKNKPTVTACLNLVIMVDY
jgi:hypothetical protein